MNYPFTSASSKKVRRLLCCALALALMTTALTGCFSKKEPDTTEDPNANVPNLVETSPETTEAPTETTETPTEPEPENIATVKEQINVRVSPSTGANVRYQLDAGEQVQVMRIESLNHVDWAYVVSVTSEAKGWVAANMLDLSNVSESILNSNTSTPAGNDPDAPTTSTEPTAPSSTNVTGKGTMGVVSASELNIRKEADKNAERVGSLKYGDRITILETNGSWGRIDKGWISTDYVYIDGTTGKNTAVGTVTASQLIVRGGPGTEYDRVGALNEGARVDILEQFKIGGYTWACIKGGWIRMDFVSTGSTSNNNNTTTPASGTATVTASALTVRSGAGTDFDSLGSLANGNTVTILEQTKVGDLTWGRINYNGNSNAWICLDYCKMN